MYSFIDFSNEDSNSNKLFNDDGGKTIIEYYNTNNKTNQKTKKEILLSNEEFNNIKFNLTLLDHQYINCSKDGPRNMTKWILTFDTTYLIYDTGASCRYDNIKEFLNIKEILSKYF